LYCAHSKCNAAKKYYERHENELKSRCGDISYIKEGVRGFMRNDGVQFADLEACRSKMS